MKVVCAVCNGEFEARQCEHLPLDAADRAAIQRAEGVAPQALYCCKPCWRLLKDPAAASQLMKGVFQQSLQLAGVPSHEAEKQAERYHAELVKRTQKARNRS